MKKTIIKTLLIALPMAVALSSGAYAKETVVPWDKVPPVVQKTIKEQAGDLKVTEVEKETKDKKTIYEAKIAQADGGTKTVEVGADGKMIEPAKAPAAKEDTKPSETEEEGGKQE